MLEDPDARVEQASVVELLRGRARPVVRVGGDEEAHADAAPRGRARCGRIIPRSVTYGLTTSRVSRRAVEQPRDRVGDRAVTARARCAGRSPGRRRRRARSPGRGRRGRRTRPPEPEEARDEDELQLADDGPCRAAGTGRGTVRPGSGPRSPRRRPSRRARRRRRPCGGRCARAEPRFQRVAAPAPRGPRGARTCVARTTQTSTPAAASCS